MGHCLLWLQKIGTVRPYLIAAITAFYSDTVQFRDYCCPGKTTLLFRFTVCMMASKSLA